MSNLVQGEAAFRLIQPGSCLIDPIRPSGFTEGGLYVIDQENQFAYKTSMFLRVIGLGPDCGELQLGGVYVCPVYCWDDYEVDGETWHITHKLNLHALVEGFDEEWYSEST